MSISRTRNFAERARLVAGVAVATLTLYGCVSSGPLRNEAMQITKEVAKGPAEAPFRAVTNFSNAVRCMDGLLQTYGIRDISILVEDLDDQTKKVSTGTKDMLLTTTSEMTRRSRAIRFVAFGSDTRNAREFMERAQTAAAYKNLPQFGIRGSISQFDDNVAKAAKDVGLGIGEFLTVGKSASATSKIVALDLTVINLADFSVLPGVASRNGVAIFGQGDGIDGEARYKKFGVNYSTSLSRSEGTAVAVRNLVELAAVELIGKMTKTPYWICLGANADDPTIKAEVEDWFESQRNADGELFGWWQYQMYIRGLYQGEANGKPNKQFADALRAYKAAMGLKPDTDLNADFMLAYLQADHNKAMAALEATRQAGSAEATEAKLIRRSGVGDIFSPGERVELTLQTNGAGYAYCFLQDETSKILRIHPNRFSRNARVEAANSLAIPATGKFALLADRNGRNQFVECYVTPRDVFDVLPPNIIGADLASLPVNSLQELRNAFGNASNNALRVARFSITVAQK